MRPWTEKRNEIFTTVVKFFIEFMNFFWIFWNIDFFSKMFRNNNLFLYRWKTDIFWEEKKAEPIYHKTLIFLKKKQFFWLLKHKIVLTNLWKWKKNVAGSGIRIYHVSLQNCVDAPTLVLYKTQTLLPFNLRSVGVTCKTKRRKKLRVLNWIFSFRIFFRQKIIKL